VEQNLASLQESLTAAKAGDQEALGRLLQSYRGYLGLLAESHIRGHLQGRMGGSDVVQETFLAAHRGFEKFRGVSEPEFRAWLRKILGCNLGRVVEQHAVAGKRNVHREVSLEAIRDAIGKSAMRLETMLAACGPSPSEAALRREDALLLADRLQGLAADHREVLVLRHIEGLPFAEVAQRMGRSSGAIRMLWMRALESLREAMHAKGEA
jgi:RNA polymerase sigma-70 factor, ECF subfamily